MQFGSGEPLNDAHWSTAFRATPRLWVFGAGSRRFGLRCLCRAEQVQAKWQEFGAFAVGQKAEVTDAHKTFGKDMQ